MLSEICIIFAPYQPAPVDARAALVFADPMTDTLPRFVVATAMRDEGPFIVEWVAWYRMLGFEILVATNDCSDHSPALLDALEAAGWVKHIRHDPPVGEPPQKAAHKVLSRHPDLLSADWVLSCDVDEFLVLHVADNILHYVARLQMSQDGKTTQEIYVYTLVKDGEDWKLRFPPTIKQLLSVIEAGAQL